MKEESAVAWVESKVKSMIENGGCEDLLPVLTHLEEAKKIEEQQHRRTHNQHLMSNYQSFEHYWKGTYKNK
jgi:hypothetical protein